MKHKSWIIATALVAILFYWIGYTVAQSSVSTQYIMGGIYPGAPTYTIWVDGLNYYAKDSNGQLDFSGTNATEVINDALAALSHTRLEKIVLDGTFPTDAPIFVYSNTIFELHGTIQLLNTTEMSYPFILTNHRDIVSYQENIWIIGGTFDGQKTLNTGNVYGLEFAYAENVHVEGVKVINTRETGIAFENPFSHGTILNSYINNTGYDGVGNQVGATDISYIGNEISWSSEGTTHAGIYMEGGYNQRVIASGNFLHHNWYGIDCLGYNYPDPHNIIIENNIVHSNFYIGIHTAPEVRGAAIKNNIVYENEADGILIQGSKNIIEGNIVYNNDNAQVSHSGIFIANNVGVPALTNATENIVSDNICFDNQTVPTQDWGIYEAVNVDFNIYSSNMLLDNQIGGIFISTAAASSNSRVVDTYNGTTWIATWGTG